MKRLIILCLLLSTSNAQILTEKSYFLGIQEEQTGEYFLGNGIVDIMAQDSLLWAATGYGLNKTPDYGKSWINYGSGDYLGKGGISAIQQLNDSTIWIALAYDTLAQEEDLPVGGGLSYTTNYGQSWTHISQPKDPRLPEDSLGYKPTTTAVQNLTYDIAFVDTTVWIASFGGGLRRSDDMGQTWKVVTTDGLPFSSLDYLNHRAFSVMSENRNLWIGTAAGISKSTDNGKTWKRFTARNQRFPISGDFVVALAYQEYIHPSTGDTVRNIWAATIEAEDSREVRAVSKSNNGGETWEIMLRNTFPHNFAFNGSVVYVAADEGLFISDDDGKNWYTLPPIRDTETGEEILTPEFYSAGVNYDGSKTNLWIGSSDGLALTKDNGNTWRVIRSFQSTRLESTPDTYAYPSPFSPSRAGYIRFQYDITRAGEVIIDIYDFAMDKVVTIKEYEQSPLGNISDRSAKWDGRNSRGDVVASGIYFFRARVENKITWGKFVVIN